MSTVFKITRWDGRMCNQTKFPSIYVDIDSALFEYLKTHLVEPLVISQTNSQYDYEQSIIGNISHLDEKMCVLNINTIWFGYPPVNGYVSFKNYVSDKDQQVSKNNIAHLIESALSSDLKESLNMEDNQVSYILFILLVLFVIFVCLSQKRN